MALGKNLDLIGYDSIEKKNIIERHLTLKKLTPKESLIHTLNMMDFMAKFKEKNIADDSGIDWITLEINKNK